MALMYTSRRVFTTERYLEMMISTKGRYALRVMIDLAQNDGESFVSLKDVAERQGISMKYLEMIVSLLHKGHMVKSQRGKAGGAGKETGRIYNRLNSQTY